MGTVYCTLDRQRVDMGTPIIGLESQPHISTGSTQGVNEPSEILGGA